MDRVQVGRKRYDMVLWCSMAEPIKLVLAIQMQKDLKQVPQVTAAPYYFHYYWSHVLTLLLLQKLLQKS